MTSRLLELAEGRDQDIGQRYLAAITQYAKLGDEDQLMAAYTLAREALDEGITLAEVGAVHHDAVQSLLQDNAIEDTWISRLEMFFIEVVSVYDMALRGFRQSVDRLQSEIAERTRVEQELRAVSAQLAEQRDDLERQVEARTAEIMAASVELQLANHQLRQSNQEQAEFTYAISHDLKSPIGTISMMLDVLRTDYGQKLGETGIGFVLSTQKTAERLQRILNDILGYSQAVDAEVSWIPVDLGALCRDIVADLQSDIRDAHADICIKTLPVVPGCETQLRILFQNLIANAIKFRNPERPAVVKVYEKPTTVDGEVCIAVQDNGIGIDPKYQRRIFSLFQRLHSEDIYPGTGLGLALCKRVIVKHNGRIDVCSAIGQGSTFLVTLKTTSPVDLPLA